MNDASHATFATALQSLYPNPDDLDVFMRSRPEFAGQLVALDRTAVQQRQHRQNALSQIAQFLPATVVPPKRMLVGRNFLIVRFRFLSGNCYLDLDHFDPNLYVYCAKPDARLGLRHILCLNEDDFDADGYVSSQYPAWRQDCMESILENFLTRPKPKDLHIVRRRSGIWTLDTERAREFVVLVPWDYFDALSLDAVTGLPCELLDKVALFAGPLPAPLHGGELHDEITQNLWNKQARVQKVTGHSFHVD